MSLCKCWHILSPLTDCQSIIIAVQSTQVMIMLQNYNAGTIVLCIRVNFYTHYHAGVQYTDKNRLFSQEYNVLTCTWERKLMYHSMSIVERNEKNCENYNTQYCTLLGSRHDCFVRLDASLFSRRLQSDISSPSTTRLACPSATHNLPWRWF